MSKIDALLGISIINTVLYFILICFIFKDIDKSSGKILIGFIILVFVIQIVIMAIVIHFKVMDKTKVNNSNYIKQTLISQSIILGVLLIYFSSKWYLTSNN